MILSKEHIKAFKNIIPKKAFNPVCTKLRYYKQDGVFFGTDTYMLMTSKKDISLSNIDYDFSIEISDMGAIKEINTIEIDKEKQKATINGSMIVPVCLDIFPSGLQNYKNIIDKQSKEYNKFTVSDKYKIFFDCVDILKFEIVNLMDGFFKVEDKENTIICRIQEKF